MLRVLISFFQRRDLGIVLVIDGRMLAFLDGRPILAELDAVRRKMFFLVYLDDDAVHRDIHCSLMFGNKRNVRRFDSVKVIHVDR